MDNSNAILQPELEWIGSRCYRVNPCNILHVDLDAQQDTPKLEYREWEDEEEEESCDADFDITTTKDGKFTSSLTIPNAYFPYLIGAKGSTKNRLESETQCCMKIPRLGMDGDIILTSSTKASICKARNRIQVLVHSARQKKPFTHFISIPCNSPSIQDNFKVFKDQILEDLKGSYNISESVFQNSSKLHLTLGTLVLMDNNERTKAGQLLKQCVEETVNPILLNNPLVLEMEGIEYMNDDPSAVDVLYGKVRMMNNADKLQLVADTIVEHLVRSGFMAKQYDQVKLHVTLMNTLFRHDTRVQDKQGKDYRTKNRETFDARKILQDYNSFNFGEHRVDTIHLSERYSTGVDGYYRSTAKAQLSHSDL